MGSSWPSARASCKTDKPSMSGKPRIEHDGVDRIVLEPFERRAAEAGGFHREALLPRPRSNDAASRALSSTMSASIRPFASTSGEASRIEAARRAGRIGILFGYPWLECGAQRLGVATGHVGVVSARGLGSLDPARRHGRLLRLRRAAGPPRLAGKPVIVGGDSPRGVVAAASYEARKYGVHSAMPGFRAAAVSARRVLPPRMARYSEVSAQVRDVFVGSLRWSSRSLWTKRFSTSADRRLFGGPLALGRRLKQRVREGRDLAASVGVAPNKLVAKIACTLGKPDGFGVVRPSGAQAARSAAGPAAVGRWTRHGRKAPARRHPEHRSIGPLRYGPARPQLGYTREPMQARPAARTARVEIDRVPKSCGEENSSRRTSVLATDRVSTLTAHAEAVARAFATRAFAAAPLPSRSNWPRRAEVAARASRRRRGARYPLLTRSRYAARAHRRRCADPRSRRWRCGTGGRRRARPLSRRVAVRSRVAEQEQLELFARNGRSDGWGRPSTRSRPASERRHRSRRSDAGQAHARHAEEARRVASSTTCDSSTTTPSRSRIGIREPRDDRHPAAIKRAPGALLARQADGPGTGAAFGQDAAVPAHRGVTLGAGPDRQRAAVDAVRDRAVVAVLEHAHAGHVIAHHVAGCTSAGGWQSSLACLCSARRARGARGSHVRTRLPESRPDPRHSVADRLDHAVRRAPVQRVHVRPGVLGRVLRRRARPRAGARALVRAISSRCCRWTLPASAGSRAGRATRPRTQRSVIAWGGVLAQLALLALAFGVAAVAGPPRSIVTRSRSRSSR